MEEVEALCDRVAIMDGGKIVAQGAVKELLATRAGGEVTLELEGTDEEQARARAAAQEPLAALVAAVAGAGARLVSAGAKKPDLEQVFLELTGKKLRDD